MFSSLFSMRNYCGHWSQYSYMIYVRWIRTNVLHIYGAYGLPSHILSDVRNASSTTVQLPFFRFQRVFT